MVLSEIKDAVVAQFEELFPNAEVWRSTPLQDFSPPAFIVRNLRNTREKRLGLRYSRHFLFVITYISDSENKEDEYDQVAEILSDGLDIISGIFRVDNLECETDGENLKITFTLERDYVQQIEKNLMNEMEVDVDGKHK
ncbi:phage tail terminator family protein [Culicoidibacter larvae]|uniref:DUF3168 domain-containing protein n=1 Tax=Culicoidibacter larvae TaxID=2579976 RepID=A0A5R8Q7E8_9FIRM|nr:hypothetical protein [Culicoidibacter larvae]TLG71375.1 hypothetical protein FEZ08_10800 [Culicoidibacter larvae]